MLKNIFILSLSIFVIAACTPTIAQRGNLIEDDQIARIEKGISTRSDILQNFGSPTTVAPFHPHIWYYIGQETAKKGILDPEVTSERVVVVAFNPDGIVEEVGELDVDRIDIPLERSKTETHGHSLTFAQQLLGNIGKFNPQGPK